MPQPNILYIHSHDTGRYVQPYGHAVRTPNIQKLAEGGVVFRQAFCAAPTCSPSRAALLTGQSPHSSGMLGLAHRGFSLKDMNQHLVHALRAAGSASTLIGQQHVAEDPQQIGYDRILPFDVRDGSGRNSAENVAPAAAQFLKSSPAVPFFLSVGFSQTHRAFPQPGPDEDPRWARPPAHLPDTPETRRDWAGYLASARELDRGVGQVLDALDEAGLAENTLVILTTDHGPAFPHMKCTLLDAGIGVMLVMRGPGGFTGGRVIDALVSQVDVFPTLCELLEIDPPGWLQGRSMLPLVRGEREEINEEVFAEVTYHAAYQPMRAVRTKRHKYIRRFGERRQPVLPNVDNGGAKDLWTASDWRERDLPGEELYDLLFDPVEGCNLAADPSCAEVLGDMRGRLQRWMQTTGDPLLAGAVPAPPGARCNDPDGRSPGDQSRIVQ